MLSLLKKCLLWTLLEGFLGGFGEAFEGSEGNLPIRILNKNNIKETRSAIQVKTQQAFGRNDSKGRAG